jgi:hypothetical protein
MWFALQKLPAENTVTAKKHGLLDKKMLNFDPFATRIIDLQLFLGLDLTNLESFQQAQPHCSR